MKITFAASVFTLVALAASCGGGASKNSPQSNASAQPSPQSNVNAAAASPTDIAQLNADIDRLEKATERNPGDEDTRDDLARAYVRRGDAERAGGQPQEALNDYQNALRLDPNNDEAQKNAADIQEQLGGEQEDENGAPLPPPITPNVTDDEENKTPAKPNEKPTPKKQ